MDQSSKKASQIQEDIPQKKYSTPKSHSKMNDACIMEMTSSTIGKNCEVTANPPRRDATFHSLDSLSRISYPRAQPNEYEMFYRAPITISQTSINDPLANGIKNKDNHETEQLRTEMTDSDGLCTSDSYTASSELSESKYDVSSLTRPTSRLAQRHQERKEQYLLEQQQGKRFSEQYPHVSSSNTDEYTPISSLCYDPEKSSMSKSSSHYHSCRKYEDYLEASRVIRSTDSQSTSPYESMEDSASKRRSGDGTLLSAGLNRAREQRVQRSSQNENYRHKNRKSMTSPNSGCWSTNTSLSYTHRLPSHSLGSTTTLTSYVDDFQHPRHHRDLNRLPRKHKSRHSSSVEDLSSVVGDHKKRSSEHRSTSSMLESDHYSKKSEQKSRHDRSLANKKDLNSRKQNVSKLGTTSGQLQNEPSSFLSSHLAIVDDLDFASLYGMGTRKLMGPALLGLLVLIMLLSLGLAIYFALGRTKDAEFSTANIRLRIINSTFGEDLSYLSKPAFERLSSEYCRQMDRYYLQSVLRKRYRGCEVISLKQQFINFTLYFTEKDISDKQVESVIETSAKFVENPVGTRNVVADNFEIEISDIKVVISQKTEKLDFDKTRLEITPEISQPAQPTSYPSQIPKTKSPPQNKNEMKINKNENDIDHKFVNIKNADIHPKEKSPINTVPRKLTTSHPINKSTISTTVPTRKAKTVKVTTTTESAKIVTTIASTTTTSLQIIRKVDYNGGIAANVSVKTAKNYSLDENGKNGIVTSADSMDKMLTRLKINKEIPLPDPCTTRNTGELISHPFFCDKFYQCVHGTGIIQSCQKGTWFDSKLKVCSLRPKGAECTLKYKMQNSTLSSSTTTISTTLTTNAMLTSPSTSAKSASPLNTPFLSEANNSSPDAAIKPKKISTDEEGNTPRHHNSNNFGAQLNHIPWKSTTQNPFEDLEVILKDARNGGRYEDNLTLNSKSEGGILLSADSGTMHNVSKRSVPSSSRWV